MALSNLTNFANRKVNLGQLEPSEDSGSVKKTMQRISNNLKKKKFIYPPSIGRAGIYFPSFNFNFFSIQEYHTFHPVFIVWDGQI